MFTAELSCPGTRDTSAVLLGNELDASYGLRTLSATGECPVFVVALGPGDSPLEDLKVTPGESPIPEYIPPAGTARVVAACANDCTGSAVLEYDTPMVA